MKETIMTPHMRTPSAFLWRDASGSVGIMVALLVPVLVSLCALAVDLPYVFVTQTRLQTASDAASLAASLKLTTSDPLVIKSTAVNIAKLNVSAEYGNPTTTNDVILGVYDPTTQVFTPDSTTFNAVKVTTYRNSAHSNELRTFFAQIIGINHIDLQATSIGLANDRPCVMALDQTAPASLSVGGSAGMVAAQCTVYVASTSSSAALSTSQAQAKKFCVVGGYSGRFSPQPKSCGPVRDPLSGIPEPTQSSCIAHPPSSGAVTLALGTYCGDLTFTGPGSFTFAPGNYYFLSSKLSISGSVDILGQGVSLFFDNKSSVNISVNGSLNLSPPSDGPYRGISLFQSRSTPGSTENIITGGGDYHIYGTIYTPANKMSMASVGSSATDAYYGTVIVGRLSLTGDSQWHSTVDRHNLPTGLAAAPLLVL